VSKVGILLAFFRQVDGGMPDLLGEERAPLILAAVDHLYPVYRQANSYSELLDEWIPGNPEVLSAEELHRRAAPIAGRHFLAAQQRAANWAGRRKPWSKHPTHRMLSTRR
jgi:hypothetical protein